MPERRCSGTTELTDPEVLRELREKCTLLRFGVGKEMLLDVTGMAAEVGWGVFELGERSGSVLRPPCCAGRRPVVRCRGRRFSSYPDTARVFWIAA